MPNTLVRAAAEGMPDDCALSQLGESIHKVLEPLPATTLSDFEYSQLQRKMRRRPWICARVRTRFYSGLLNACTAYETAARHGRTDGLFRKTMPKRDLLVTAYRLALVEQMLTPAPDMDAVAWKKRALANGLTCWPISKDEAEEAIAADLDFLKAHP